MRVVQLWRYPVKSAQGESVRRSVVTSVGLQWDRQIAVVDEASGRALTGRREPRLLYLSASIVGDRVSIRDPDGRALTSDEDVSCWLGRPVRLARPPIHRQPEYEFPVDAEDESASWGVWKGPADVWHDSTRTQVSIISTSRLGDWPVRRFRPNVVIDDADDARLVGRRIVIGSVVLDVVKRIDRCVMVTRAQPGGIAPDLDVLRTVARESDGFLGVGALVTVPGEIGVDDCVEGAGPAQPTAAPPTRPGGTSQSTT